MTLSWRNFWFESKAWVEDVLGMSRDLIHVHVGLAIFLSCAILFRKRRHGLLMAWLVVATLQAFNELLDARDWVNWTGSVNWGEIAKDCVATLFWPTVIILSWRFLRTARW